MATTPQHPAGSAPPAVLWSLSFARGYTELGMYAAALKELDRLDPKHQALRETLLLRCAVLTESRRWRALGKTARQAIERHPRAADFHIFLAIALDRQERAAEAKIAWLSAPARARDSSLFHYSIARCEARLGNRSEARHHLELALQLEPHLEAAVVEDPSLRSLLPELGQN
jgi:tetratricopeptide (TPR) repeat protein